MSGISPERFYSFWALKSGYECVCRPESVLVQAYDEDGNSVGPPYEAKLHETTPRYSARITRVEYKP